MVFDPTVPSIDIEQSRRQDWTLSIYGDVKIELPPNMPESRGQGFTMRVYVDYDLGGDCVTRWSRTRFAVFLNGALIYCISKKQASGENLTFGSKLCAMKQAT